jgi:predicted nuclease with TOPRIM domain
MAMTHEELRSTVHWQLDNGDISDLLDEFDGVLADRDRMCADLANANVLEDTLQHRIDELEQERERLQSYVESLLRNLGEVHGWLDECRAENGRLRAIIREQPYPASPDSEPTEPPSLSDADISNQLRRLGSGCVGTISGSHCQLMNEAADLIEKLRAENERLLSENIELHAKWRAVIIRNDQLRLLNSVLQETDR